MSVIYIYVHIYIHTHICTMCSAGRRCTLFNHICVEVRMRPCLALSACKSQGVSDVWRLQASCAECIVCNKEVDVNLQLDIDEEEDQVARPFFPPC